MDLACSLSGFANERLESALARAAWAGYRAVEWVQTADGPPAEAVRERLRREGLRAAAIRAGDLPIAVEPGTFDALAAIGRTAVWAHQAGAPRLIVGLPAVGDVAAGVRLLRQLDAALGDLLIAISLCPGASALGQAAALLAHGLPGRFGLALDPVQILLAGGRPEELKALPALPDYVYLNSTRLGRPVPPTEGDWDPAELVASLAAAGFGGTLCVRLDNAEPWRVEPIARECREAAESWIAASGS